LKILLTSIGTRGDIEPFLALGEILRDQGHQVAFAFPEQFAVLIPIGFDFYPLSRQVIELIESEEGRIIMGGKASLLRKTRALWHLYREGQRINRLLVRQQFDIVAQLQPDKIIHNVKCSYPTLWAMQKQKETILMSPVPYFMYYVEGQAHIGFKGNLGKWLNLLTYRLANFGLVKTIRDAQRYIPMKQHYKTDEIREALFSKKLIYAISPVLFKRPDYWPAHVQVTGYQQRKQTDDWQRDEKLMQFLSAHQRVLFITFGSMVNQHPEATSRLIYAVAKEAGIPLVVNIAAGGLIALEKYLRDPLFHFVQSIPYDWILPRVYAVVHHGGSGTTHLGLKYGCPTLILPHVIDQFAWNALVHKIEAGPKGIGISKLSSQKLTHLMQDLMLNPAYQHSAKQLSQAMAKERGLEKLQQLTDLYS
jgi:UDP:flavonoid glycosyltransferase YjiC (YdhE family)